LDATYKQIHVTWKKNHQLPDNLSELLRQAHDQLPPPVLQKIDDTLGLDRTNLFDSHPSAADRIRQARKAGEPGIFHDHRPAAELFASFDHPARFVTLLHYTDDLGIPITQQMLLHVESTRPRSPGQPAAARRCGCSTPALRFRRNNLPSQMRPPTQRGPPRPRRWPRARRCAIHCTKWVGR
jgi:hypothetical protein